MNNVIIAVRKIKRGAVEWGLKVEDSFIVFHGVDFFQINLVRHVKP